MDDQLREIYFFDFVDIFKKRKKMIIFFLFIFLAFGVVWFFAVPSKYSGKTSLQIGFVNEVSALGLKEKKTLENQSQVLEKIRSGVYGGVNEAEAVNPADTYLIEISLSGDSYDEVKKQLNNIISAIIESHSIIISQSKLKKDILLEILNEEKKSIDQDIAFLMARNQQVESLKLETHKIEFEENIIKKEFSANPTEVISGPVVQEKRPSPLIIVISAFLGFFLGMIFAVFAEKFPL